VLLLAGLALAGLALLTVAADQLVLGAGRLAERFGISAVVVGVVVIGLGTSMPEFMVSGLAAARGDGGLAVANLVGSNIVNVTLILGLAALVAPVVVRSSVVRREAPLSVAGVALFAVFALSGVGLVAALVLGAALAAALVVLVRLAHETPERQLETEVREFLDNADRPHAGREALRALLALAGTLAGAQLLVVNAVAAAHRLGVSQTVLGFTVVAIGTSLPELVTAVQAQSRGDSDLLLGNLLGSNLVNSLCGGAVTGFAGLAGPGRTPRVGYPLVAAMVAVSLLTWFVLYRGYRVSRFEAALLLIAYGLTLPLAAP